MSPIIPISTWLHLKQETRAELRKIFNIPRTGGVEVVDNHIVSDGTLPRDLQVVTLKALQDVLDSDSTNFFELLNEMVDTIEHKEEPQEVIHIKVELPTEEVKQWVGATGDAAPIIGTNIVDKLNSKEVVKELVVETIDESIKNNKRKYVKKNK